MTENLSIHNDSWKGKNTLQNRINTRKNFFEKFVDRTSKNRKIIKISYSEHPRNLVNIGTPRVSHILILYVKIAKSWKTGNCSNADYKRISRHLHTLKNHIKNAIMTTMSYYSDIAETLINKGIQGIYISKFWNSFYWI